MKARMNRQERSSSTLSSTTKSSSPFTSTSTGTRLIFPAKKKRGVCFWSCPRLASRSTRTGAYFKAATSMASDGTKKAPAQKSPSRQMARRPILYCYRSREREEPERSWWILMVWGLCSALLFDFIFLSPALLFVPHIIYVLGATGLFCTEDMGSTKVVVLIFFSHIVPGTTVVGYRMQLCAWAKIV
jgi:hypothetical protein